MDAIGNEEEERTLQFRHTYLQVKGVPMCMSYEFVHELNENKGQFARIRDENGKFRSILPDCPNSIPYSTF